MIQEPIENLSQVKRDLSGKIIFSIFIATALSTLASCLVTYFAAFSLYMIIGLIAMLVCAAVLYGYHTSKKMLRMEIVIPAFFAYNRKTNKCVPIERYRYSQDFVDNFNALFAENPNEQQMWNKDRLKFMGVKHNFSAELLKENVEYCVLQTLSITLTDYFNNNDKKCFVQTYERDDLAAFLTQNRFLNTFSRPMEERTAFVENLPKGRQKGTIVFAMGKNGAQYNKFDLVLPKKSVIEKTSDGFIIKTPKLTLRAGFDIEGYCFVGPRKFERYYLNILDLLDRDIFLYKMYIRVNVKFNFWKSLFGQIDTSHRWVDRFIKKLQSDYSKDEFFAQIDWEHNLLIYELILNRK